MRLLIALTALACLVLPSAALARPKPRWVQVEGWADDRAAGFLDMKSLKKTKHRSVRANGLLVAWRPDGEIDRVRVALEFDCGLGLYKRQREVNVDARGIPLPDQPDADPAPITEASGLKSRGAALELACRPKGSKKKNLVFRSEESAVAWARVHAPMEMFETAEPPPAS